MAGSWWFLVGQLNRLRLVGADLLLQRCRALVAAVNRSRLYGLRLRRSKPLQLVSAGDQEFLEWVPGTGTVASMHLRNPALEISAGFPGPFPSSGQVLLPMRVSLHRN